MDTISAGGSQMLPTGTEHLSGMDRLAAFVGKLWPHPMALVKTQYEFHESQYSWLFALHRLLVQS